MTTKVVEAEQNSVDTLPAISLATYHKLLHGISALILLGFVPSYVWQFSALTAFHHYHAMASLLWLILLNLQPLLIARGNAAHHRRLGWFALVAAALMSLSTTILFVSTYTHRVGSSEIFSLVYTLDLFLFPAFMIFIALAMHYRRQPLIHANYIVLSAIMLLPPGLGRLIYGVVFMPLGASQRLFFEPMVMATLAILVYLGYREQWRYGQTRWTALGLMLSVSLAYVVTYGSH